MNRLTIEIIAAIVVYTIGRIVGWSACMRRVHIAMATFVATRDPKQFAAGCAAGFAAKFSVHKSRRSELRIGLADCHIHGAIECMHHIKQELWK
jgi:hypothetical protein